LTRFQKPPDSGGKAGGGKMGERPDWTYFCASHTAPVAWSLILGRVLVLGKSAPGGADFGAGERRDDFSVFFFGKGKEAFRHFPLSR